MKPGLFKYSVLTVGVVAAMGVVNTANAAKLTADSTPTIDNIATATYSIAGIAQTPVVSNTVTVNITQSAAFSLEAKNVDDNINDDFNKGAIVTPNGRVAFNHTLSNSGNVKDTYTLNLIQGGTMAGTVQDTSSYDLATTNVTYIIYNADKSEKSRNTVSGTDFQNTKIELAPLETASILISAKAKGNVGGNSQNLTLSAASTFFTNADPTKATLNNINNSITKVPVFQITSKVSNTLNLNDSSSKATYTITIRNDDRAPYATNAQNIVVFDGLPAGLRLADNPNLKVDNGASITAGQAGKGPGNADDSITVTLLNLAPGKEAVITFDVQKDQAETLADPKNTINHAVVTLDLGEGGIIYDTTDPLDTEQNTKNFYPVADDSENLTGAANNAIGGDSATPLTANQRAINLTTPNNKEIPTSTSATSQVTLSAVITNDGKETEGDQPGEIRFTIAPGPNNKVTVVTGSVELVYDPDNNPATPNFTYTITRDSTGINDLSTAVPKDGAPAWTGMAPGSTVTINYKVESKDAIINTDETITITLVVGGTDAPTVGGRVIQNITTIKGLKLVKEQALNETCSATATLTFTQSPVPAKPGNCVVYKISAFNDFSDTDARFAFDSIVMSDTIARFNNKAQVLSSTTTPAFEIKLDDVATSAAVPTTNKYAAGVGTTSVSGTVIKLEPQKYAAMIFAIKINELGAANTP